MTLKLPIFFCLICIVLIYAAPQEESSSTQESFNESGTKRILDYLSEKNIQTCSADTADLNQCLLRMFDALFPLVRDGSKELNLPPIDPFSLNKTSFEYRNGAIAGRLLMKSAKIYGLSKLQHKYLDVKLVKDKMVAHAKVYIPELIIVGLYKAEININNVRMRPKGNFTIRLSNLNIDQTAEGVLEERKEHRYARLTKLTTKPQIGNFKFQASGMFPDPQLNEIAEGVINEYWHDVYNVLLPEMSRYWEPIMLRVSNEVINTLPIDVFIKLDADSNKARNESP